MATTAAPLEQTLTALANRAGTSPLLLERIAGTLDGVPAGNQASLRAALAGHPHLPLPHAEMVCNLHGSGSPSSAGLTALVCRADLTDEQLTAAMTTLAQLSLTGRRTGTDLAALAESDRTPARVVALLPRLMGTARLPRYKRALLVTHRNASAEVVVEVLQSLCTGSGESLPGQNSGLTLSYYTSTIEAIRPELAAAAFDRIEHPSMLVDLAEAHHDLLDSARVDRLAEVAIISGGAWPRGKRNSGAKSHPLTRAVAVVRDLGSVETRRRCADALDAGPMKILGQHGCDALGLPVSGQRATAAFGSRRFNALARSLPTNPGTADALGAELSALNDAEWDIFLRFADDFSGTLDGFIDLCRGISAPASRFT